jgi:hypothetical protein
MKHNVRVALASAFLAAGVAVPALAATPALAGPARPLWCGDPVGTPGRPTDCPTVSVSPTTVTTSPAPVESLGTTVGGITFTKDPVDDPTTSDDPASVLGETFTKVDAAADPASASALPFSGAEISGMVVTSIALIGGGAILMITSRRRRGTHTS